jgi:hypothetical protein
VALILGGDYEREMAAIRMLTTDREKALEQHSLSIAREAPIIVSSGAAGPEHLIDLGAKALLNIMPASFKQFFRLRVVWSPVPPSLADVCGRLV